ncbi:MAG: DUF1697 domain-containing protein [Gemmatimonadota bacterium]|nr:DUF1697 domain-containing protein [Gemmatimonadota bacterium]
MPATHLALLRGINVGGKNKLPMSDLLDLFAEAGCRDVRTYIQSGNVIFTAEPAVVTPLPGRITARIQERFGYRVPVVMRTAEELGDIVRHNPFIAAEVDEATLHVLFLAGRPAARAIDDLDPDRSPPDTFVVHNREVYLQLPHGAARTKLTNAYFDAKLATTSTGRNWRTVTMLHTLIEG